MRELKAQSGGDLIAYGGRALVSSLIAQSLLDNLYLFVNPVAIGKGLPVFPGDSRQQLTIVEARPFECGITLLHFRPKRA